MLLLLVVFVSFHFVNCLCMRKHMHDDRCHYGWRSVLVSCFEFSNVPPLTIRWWNPYYYSSPKYRWLKMLMFLFSLSLCHSFFAISFSFGKEWFFLDCNKYFNKTLFYLFIYAVVVFPSYGNWGTWANNRECYSNIYRYTLSFKKKRRSKRWRNNVDKRL